MQAPSLDREIEAAAASLGDGFNIVGMNSMANASKHSRDTIARAQQPAQQFAQDEEADYDDGYNAHDDDDYSTVSQHECMTSPFIPRQSLLGDNLARPGAYSRELPHLCITLSNYLVDDN